MFDAQPVDRREPEPHARPAAAASGGTADAAWRPLFDPAVLLMGVVRSRRIVLACGVAGALLGIVVAVMTPKIFAANSQLLIDPRDLKIVDRDLNQTGFSSEAALAIVENQMRIIGSGTVLNKVVDRLDLTADPEFNGTAAGGIPNPLSALRSLISSAGGNAGDPGYRRAVTVDNLARHVSVTRDGATFVVSVAATSLDGDKAARIANAVTTGYIETTGEFEAATVGRAADELGSRLDQMRSDVEEAERKVTDFKTTNGIVDAQGRLISDDEILKLNDQLSVARARLAELRARAESARSASVDQAIMGNLPEQVNSATLGQLRAQFATLNQEANRLGVRLGPRHPQRLAIQAQLDGARDQIAAELRRVNASVQVELSRAQDLETQLSARLAELKTRQGELGGDLVALRELERDASSRRAVYEAFLLRARETGEQQNINTANVSVISAATAPLRSSGTSRAVIAIAGLILGLAVGVMIGLARGAWTSLHGNAGWRAANTREAPAQPVATPRLDMPVARAPQVATTPVPKPSEFPRRSPAPVPAQASWPASVSRLSDGRPAPVHSEPVEDLKASLREFRDSVRQLAESRRRDA